VWARVLSELQARAEAAGLITWDVSVDSTIARAHQHAAGARRDPGGQKEPPGGVGGDEPPDHALGRSRGGLTTKVHLACEQGRRPLSLVVTAGQRGDSPQFTTVLERIRVNPPGPGRLLAGLGAGTSVKTKTKIALGIAGLAATGGVLQGTGALGSMLGTGDTAASSSSPFSAGPGGVAAGPGGVAAGPGGVAAGPGGVAAGSGGAAAGSGGVAAAGGGVAIGQNQGCVAVQAACTLAPQRTPPPANPGVIRFVGGCTPFHVYAQNRWLPYGTAVRTGPSPDNKVIGNRDPNQLITVDGWVHGVVPYPHNSPPWNNDKWFHLADGAGWVSFAGVRAVPTAPDPTLSADGGMPAPTRAACQGSAQ
jgi:hypothetical protein